MSHGRQPATAANEKNYNSRNVDKRNCFRFFFVLPICGSLLIRACFWFCVALIFHLCIMCDFSNKWMGSLSGSIEVMRTKEYDEKNFFRETTKPRQEIMLRVQKIRFNLKFYRSRVTSSSHDPHRFEKCCFKVEMLCVSEDNATIRHWIVVLEKNSWKIAVALYLTSTHPSIRSLAFVAKGHRSARKWGIIDGEKIVNEKSFFIGRAINKSGRKINNLTLPIPILADGSELNASSTVRSGETSLS